jgi:hypothetical protein
MIGGLVGGVNPGGPDGDGNGDEQPVSNIKQAKAKRTKIIMFFTLSLI